MSTDKPHPKIRMTWFQRPKVPLDVILLIPSAQNPVSQ